MKIWVYALILIITCIICGALGYSAGDADDAGLLFQIEVLKANVAELEHELAIAQIPEYQESDEYEWLKPLIDNIKTANVTFEFDENGYKHGIISIYFERDNSPILYEPEIDWQWFERK